MSDSNKNIKYALGAGIAVIGAALVYMLMKSDSGSGEDYDQPAVDKDDLEQRIEAEKLRQVAYEPNSNRIQNEYFLKLLQFVGVQTRQQLEDQRKVMVAKRRQHFKQENWDAYREIVSKLLQMEDKMATEILNCVLEMVQIPEQEFAAHHMRLSQDPKFMEFVMAAQQGKLTPGNQDQPVKMTKKQTMKHLELTQQVQQKQMSELAGKMNMKQPTTPEEQMAMMTDMMVEQCKAQDRIFIEAGEEFENEEFEGALLHYCARDQEVAAAMQKYMMSMRQAMPMQ